MKIRIMYERTFHIALIMAVLALMAGMSTAQDAVYAGAGAYASGGASADGTDTTRTSCPASSQCAARLSETIQTFSLGDGYSYFIMPVSLSQSEISNYQSQGVQMVRVPAGTNVYVTTSVGPAGASGQLQVGGTAGAAAGIPNMIVFGPGGAVSLSTFTGVSVTAGPEGASHTFTFTDSPGQSYLVVQKSPSQHTGVLVVFEQPGVRTQ